MMTRQDRIAALKAAAKQRILILDGAWGVMIQRQGLAEADYRGERFADHPGQLKGNNDILCLTRPDIITELHDAYFGAGADISETNTFSSTSIAQADYELQGAVRDLNLAGARLAREAADRWTAKTPDKPRFVAGSMGPLNRMLSMSSDVNDPGARTVTFDQVYQAYREQALALHEGGVDMFLLETITDTLNVKAGIKAILDLEDEGLEPLPIWISGTITDRSGRTLSGQTVEAFWNSVKHAKPFAVGLNCALGADLMRPHIADLARVADTLVSAYPNAGLPNAMGQYDETPDETSHELHEWAEHGLVNILGGCCGTTPEHIAHVAQAVAGLSPRAPADPPAALRLAGLEPFELAS
ncbi:homocysteine S-methyltransferase family protein [Phenylobacterium sp.]|jgi:5-methyltetrahydrofolate--homocysteine methyltransferase|uniref:homocysteine S-methyltransferase family protein n=1 Tax=Phenylobacterium sp. TaxID=1871053 RepID=UPI0039C8C441